MLMMMMVVVVFDVRLEITRQWLLYEQNKSIKPPELYYFVV
jgi:hypothetical protein